MEAKSVKELRSITPQFSKIYQGKVKHPFDEFCEDERLQDPKSFFKKNIFYRVLYLLLMNKIDLDFSIFIFKIIIN